MAEGNPSKGREIKMYIHIITPARSFMMPFIGEVHFSERDPDSFVNALKGDMINPLSTQSVTSIQLVNVSVHDKDENAKNLNLIAKGFNNMGYWICWCE